MRASMLARESLLGREIKVVVANPSNVAEGKAIKFAKKVTKHIRVSRGWSFVSASVESMGIREFTRNTSANRGHSYRLRWWISEETTHKRNSCWPDGQRGAESCETFKYGIHHHGSAHRHGLHAIHDADALRLGAEKLETLEEPSRARANANPA